MKTPGLFVSPVHLEFRGSYLEGARGVLAPLPVYYIQARIRFFSRRSF